MHIENFKRAGMSGVISHIERSDDKKNKIRDYSNENIDKEKTYMNYNLIEKGSVKKINERLETLKGKKEYRKDANLLCSLVVQIPRDEKGELTIKDEKEQKRFFEGILDYSKGKFGEDNIMVASVHMDETTPHIHCCFIPVSDDRVSCRAVVNKTLLRTMHSDCEKHMEKFLGYKVCLRSENSLTNENLSMKDYSVKMEMEKLKQKENEINNKLKELKSSDKAIVCNNLEEIKSQVKDGFLGKTKVLDNEAYNKLMDNNILLLKQNENLKEDIKTSEKHYNILYNFSEDLEKKYNNLLNKANDLKNENQAMKKEIQEIKKESQDWEYMTNVLHGYIEREGAIDDFYGYYEEQKSKTKNKTISKNDYELDR